MALASFPSRREESGCVAAPVAVEEPRRRGAGSDELEIDIGAVFPHIREGAAESVHRVEQRVGLDLDLRAGRQKADKDGSRRVSIALALVRLGSVELHEAHVAAVPEDDRVAVENAVDCRGSVLASAGEGDEDQRDSEEAAHCFEGGSRCAGCQVALGDFLRRASGEAA
jgi:hypothetical protein